MRVTVAAWIGSANAGDELIFAALRAKLVARGARVTAITAHARDADGGVPAVGHLDAAAVWRAVAGGDALVFGGGGLLQDQTSSFNLPLHLSRLWIAGLTRTPHAVVGVGAGPLQTRIGRGQVRRALRGATAVTVRDRPSARTLRRAGVRGVRVTADLAVSLPSPQVAPADAITACLRPWRGGRNCLPVATRAARDVTPEAMVDRLARGLDAAAGALGLPVRLVAMQRGWDDLLHARVARRLRAPVTLLSPPPERVVAEIAATRVVVAMRYHAAVAAILAGRPAALIGYAPKVAAIGAEMGPAARMVGWTPEALDGLADAVLAVAGRDHDLPAVLSDLRARERGNDTVLDDLLTLAEARR
ncbi:MAG TPA: polysaccharide pyruvyl transferase family protein [Euzebyales bacterium]